MGMSQEQAAAAFHAAKMAQLNALGHNFDKLPVGLLPPHLDLSKMSSPDLARIQSAGLASNEQANNKGLYNNERSSADIRRDDVQPMDLGLENSQTINDSRHGHVRGNGDGIGGASHGGNSSGEDEYGSDEDIDTEHN